MAESKGPYRKAFYGLYDTIAPVALRNCKFHVNVPFANMFVTYALGIEKFKEPEMVENCKNILIKYLQSDECKTMSADLSVAALINTNSDLQKEDIKWEEPQIDFYALKWDEVSVYPSAETRNKLFKKYICDKNPEWTEQQIDELLRKYSDKDNPNSGSDDTGDAEATKQPTISSISEDQLELDKEMIDKSTKGLRNLLKRRI